MLSFEKTKLWQRTLGEQKKDAHAESRAKLRQAYFNMRENAQLLVSTIPADCPGLTDHSIVHLDALWEMADILVEDNFALNPVEAFVLGGAILLHDSAMSVASFPGGKEELRSHSEWTDAAYAASKKRKLPTDDPKFLNNLDAIVEREVIFSVLRSLHASQAEKLATLTWGVPHSSDVRHFVDDANLRKAFGQSIGTIAHSHHWDIDSLERNLRSRAGTEPSMPSEWVLNEVKVACLLRCADICHIDSRRAPSLLYALMKPSGISDEHWDFQNKLNKPMRNAGLLVYSSNEAFAKVDVPAWWRCYDAIQAVSSEISNTNALLGDIGLPKFAVDRVDGADSPAALARNIKTHGWRPIKAELTVTDPAHLASTLGGKNLYGSGPKAPLRELLQNSIDAIRHRLALDLDKSDARIVVTVEHDPADTTKVILHVDDNGIGMSERVLTGPLLDFGRSFWSTPLMREEYPGLESKNVKPIGKFGIGFFAVFLLGQSVKVISKRYDEGIKDTRVLEFTSIGNRPILYEGSKSELPSGMNTRVTVVLDDPNFKDDYSSMNERFYRYSGRTLRRNSGDINWLLSTWLPELVASLDLPLKIVNHLDGSTHIHDPNWVNSDPGSFLELLITSTDDDNASFLGATKPMLRPLYEDNGRPVGLAALNISKRRAELNHLSVGGITYVGDGPFDYIGILEGETGQIARSHAVSSVSEKAIGVWASEQARLLQTNRFTPIQLLEMAWQIHGLGGDTGPLPFCFLGGQFVTLDTFQEYLKSNIPIDIIISSRSYSNEMSVVGANELSASYFTQPIYGSVCAFDPINNIFDDEEGRRLISQTFCIVEKDEYIEKFSQQAGMKTFIKMLDMVWKLYDVTFQTMQVFSSDLYFMPDRRNVLRFQKRQIKN